MNMVIQVQILDKTTSILQRANTLGKGKHPTIHPRAMAK